MDSHSFEQILEDGLDSLSHQADGGVKSRIRPPYPQRVVKGD